MKNDIKLLIIIRHGERTDRVGEIPKCGTLNPELTDKGKLLAKKIEDDAELFVNEKYFLSKTGTKLKDTKITELTSRKLGL